MAVPLTHHQHLTNYLNSIMALVTEGANLAALMRDTKDKSSVQIS